MSVVKMSVGKNLADVRARMARAEVVSGRAPGAAALIAVSKTRSVEEIEAAINAGQKLFGENRVQEAARKFPALKLRYPDIELHLIGPLQSNKAREAVGLFDVIHSVDREKIAVALGKEMQLQGRRPLLLVQVNVGEEPQKAGISPKELPKFLRFCRDEQKLSIAGLMCIPPVDEAPAPYFMLLSNLARENGLTLLSMGMSADFETAVQFGAAYIRVGTAIFGVRD